MSAMSINYPPDLPRAKLPASYDAAKKALAECSRMDECQDWANKAEALASYAAQADDDQLRKMADRIQARAIRRAHELLKQFPEGRGGDQKAGARPLNTRRQAADNAGMSRHQYRTAMDVGYVSEAEFEEQVESDSPPTVTALAKQGRQARTPDIGDYLKGRDPNDYYNATHATGALKNMVKATVAYSPDSVARGLSAQERAAVKKSIKTVDAWLDRLITQL